MNKIKSFFQDILKFFKKYSKKVGHLILLEFWVYHSVFFC